MAKVQASTSDKFKERVGQESEARGMNTSEFVKFCLEHVMTNHSKVKEG